MTEFAFLFRGRDPSGPAELQQAVMEKWSAWMKSLHQRGVITNPGQPLHDDGMVVSGRDKVVSDGPFAETKDLINGFIVVQAASLAEAAELAKGCPILEQGGRVEVRPVQLYSPDP
jgi:hypothetical protein